MTRVGPYLTHFQLDPCIQYDSAPKKAQLSDSMRNRLLAEASTGLDPDAKQTNVLLYIMAGVAVLVILGGQGIFF